MTSDRIPIVTPGSPPATIVLRDDPSAVELRAAQELQKYVLTMTGQQLPISSRCEATTTSILLGQPHLHSQMARLRQNGDLHLPENLGDTDGFVLKTGYSEHVPFVALSCGREPACLYAVYHLLQRYWQVGFFDDYERIPERPILTLPLVEEARLPRFLGRQNLQGCSAYYTGRFWSAEEWQRELEWSVKRGFDIVHVSLGAPVLRYEAMRGMGVSVERPSALDYAHLEIGVRCAEYARSLGLRVVLPAGTLGQVTESFREHYPHAYYFHMQWFDYPPQLFLHPADPLFGELLRHHLAKADALYGASDLYALDLYAEMEPPGSLAERESAKRAFSETAVQVLRTHNPLATWVVSGWGFVERKYWPLEHIAAALEPFPDDMLVLNDLTSNYTTSDGLTKLYRETEGFFGKTWGWTIFHCFGGNTHLHGDVRELIRNAEEVSAYPSARWSYHAPEAIRHNALYYDLASHLSWSPEPVDLDEYLLDYAVRRYGEQGARRMHPVLRLLCDTVYSWYDMNDWHGPIYQFVPVRPDKPWWHRRASFVPVLARATQLILDAADILGNEACYRRDLVDISKEYAGNVITAGVIALWSATDLADFDQAVTRIRAGMDAVEQIVSTLPEYRMQEEIEAAMRAPYSLPPEHAIRDIRMRYTVLIDFEHYDTLLDYARRDMYELVRYYYRPRVELLIRHLEECLRAGREVSEEYLHEGAREIAWQFVDFAPTEPAGTYPDPVEIVRKTLSALLPQDWND